MAFHRIGIVGSGLGIVARFARGEMMRWGLVTLLLVGAPLLATPSWKHTTHREETAEIARGFMHMQYDLKDLRGAKARYYSPDFIQHNPEIKNGVNGDANFIDARRSKDPAAYLPVEQWVNVIDHVLVQDKYFAVHHHLFTSAQDKGRVFLDIWRTENGKMVEHWDIIQPVYENPLNSNTMWSNLVNPRQPQSNEPSPESVLRSYLRIGLEEHDASRAAELYVDPHFVQHSPHIAGGKANLIDYFRKREASSNAQPIESVSHILVDGDLALVTRHSMPPGDDRGTMAADLFRIQHGKIVEHWDVKQAVPAASVNGNTMW